MNGIAFNPDHLARLSAAFVLGASAFIDRRMARRNDAKRWRHAALAAIRAGLATIDLWCSRATQRRILAEFDDQRLQDIGITRAQAEAEIAKPFWR
ncbi:MAG: DUF1127 domain-containing protein [Variibacter sp.]